VTSITRRSRAYLCVVFGLRSEASVYGRTDFEVRYIECEQREVTRQAWNTYNFFEKGILINCNFNQAFPNACFSASLILEARRLQPVEAKRKPCVHLLLLSLRLRKATTASSGKNFNCMAVLDAYW